MVKKINTHLSLSGLLLSGVLLGGNDNKCCAKKSVAEVVSADQGGNEDLKSSDGKQVTGAKPSVLTGLSDRHQKFIQEAFVLCITGDPILTELSRSGCIEPLSDDQVNEISARGNKLTPLFDFVKNMSNNSAMYGLSRTSLKDIVMDQSVFGSESSLKGAKLEKKIALAKALNNIASAYNGYGKLAQELYQTCQIDLSSSDLMTKVEQTKDGLLSFKKEFLGYKDGVGCNWYDSKLSSNMAFYKHGDKDCQLDHSYEFLNVIHKTPGNWAKKSCNDLLVFFLEEKSMYSQYYSFLGKIQDAARVTKEGVGFSSHRKISGDNRQFPEIKGFPGLYMKAEASKVDNLKKGHLADVGLCAADADAGAGAAIAIADGNMGSVNFSFMFEDVKTSTGAAISATLLSEPVQNTLNDYWGENRCLAMVDDDSMTMGRLFFALFADEAVQAEGVDVVGLKISGVPATGVGKDLDEGAIEKFAIKKDKLAELLTWASTDNDENRKSILAALNKRFADKSYLSQIFPVYKEESLKRIIAAIDGLVDNSTISCLDQAKVVSLLSELKKHIKSNVTNQDEVLCRYVAIRLVNKINSLVVDNEGKSGIPLDDVDAKTFKCKQSTKYKAENLKTVLKEELGKIKANCIYVMDSSGSVDGGQKVIEMLKGLANEMREYKKSEKLTYGEISSVPDTAGKARWPGFKIKEVYDDLVKQTEHLEKVCALPELLKAIATKPLTEEVHYSKELNMPSMNAMGLNALRKKHLNLNVSANSNTSASA